MQKKLVKKENKASKVIRISQKNFERISSYAENFREPVDAVLSRILDKADKVEQK